MKLSKKATRHAFSGVTVTALLCLLVVGVSAISGTRMQNDRAAERAARVAELRSVLRDEQLRRSAPERVHRAIEELGREPATEAIPDLIQLLTFEKELNTNLGDFRITTLGSRYPAASALFQIGEDALPALVKVIETQDEDSVASRSALYSITSILVRKSPAAAVNFLEDAAARAASPEAGRRLSKAADKTKKLLTEKPTP